MARMQFGVMLPQIKRSWSDSKAAAQTADRLGFHSVWFNDHLYGIPMPSIPIMEAWTALSAVGAVTERVELGTLVTPIGFRNPAMLAKMVATLDNISNGRVVVGLGSGWFAQEFSGYGIDFPPVQDRLRQLEEGIELMRRMWSEEQVTFNGRYYKTDDVFCAPKPVRRPPIHPNRPLRPVFRRAAASGRGAARRHRCRSARTAGPGPGHRTRRSRRCDPSCSCLRSCPAPWRRTP